MRPVQAAAVRNLNIATARSTRRSHLCNLHGPPTNNCARWSPRLKRNTGSVSSNKVLGSRHPPHMSLSQTSRITAIPVTCRLGFRHSLTEASSKKPPWAKRIIGLVGEFGDECSTPHWCGRPGSNRHGPCGPTDFKSVKVNHNRLIQLIFLGRHELMCKKMCKFWPETPCPIGNFNGYCQSPSIPTIG